MGAGSGSDSSSESEGGVFFLVFFLGAGSVSDSSSESEGGGVFFLVFFLGAGSVSDSSESEGGGVFFLVRLRAFNMSCLAISGSVSDSSSGSVGSKAGYSVMFMVMRLFSSQEEGSSVCQMKPDSWSIKM